MKNVSEHALESARGWLAPIAERVLTALEDPAERVIGPPPPPKSLESELLAGQQQQVFQLRQHQQSSSPVTPAEAQQLQRDFGELLAQRAQLRAQLVVEQERRERAEAELVAIGAQWLGTDTQAALRRRAEAEKQRAIDAEKEQVQREADQRVARVEAEKLLLMQQVSCCLAHLQLTGPVFTASGGSQLGKEAPSTLSLKLKLQTALHAELAEARQEILQVGYHITQCTISG